MSDYLLGPVTDFHLLLLEKGTFLVISRVEAVPPHLLLLTDQKLYSIGIYGPKFEIPLIKHLEWMKRKSVPTVFVELNTELAIQNTSYFKIAEKQVRHFECVKPGLVTCLNPLKSFCEEIFKIDASDINFIYELHQELQKRGLIKKNIGFGLEPFMFNHYMPVRRYSLKDIFDSMYQPAY